MEKKRRNQIIDIEEYLTNISKYIGEVTFNKGNVNVGEPIQLILIHLGREKEAFDNFAHKVRTLIRQHPNYIDYNYRGSSLYESLREINDNDLKQTENISPSDFEKFKRKINSVQDLYERIEFTIEKDEFIKKLNIQTSEMEETVKDVQAAKEVLEGKKTEEIFSQASKTYLEAARNYEVIFYLIFFASFLFTVINLCIFPYSDETKINFIFSKVIAITVVITLGTLFLRKASHLRKLHEQAHQTSLELQALPMFLKSIDKVEHSEVYKKLAEKYFGKELDQSQNDKIGDLMKDQLAAGTELIKASAEMVKAKGESKPAP